MVDEREYKRLKALADDAKTARDKAEGQLESAMTTLKEEFECDTLERAEKVLAKLEAEAAAAEKVYDTEKAKFEKEWDERIGDA